MRYAKQPSNTDKLISERSIICLASNPSVRGIVISSSLVDDIPRYEVFIEGEIKVYYDGQILAVAGEHSSTKLDARCLQSYLTAYQINNPSADTLYSINSARIDFVPYQFRPALKMIKSDSHRLLIADSVGVGKTIETGLILKELGARLELENIIIICPKPLVAERKWELEMKRFDEEFVHVDGKAIRQIISDTHRDGEWPSKFKKAIIPYSLFDNDLLFGKGGSKKHTNNGLIDLDPAPHFDMVIVDEAHHIRNSDSQRYNAVKYFCDHSDAVVFLTATPLQTSDENLYTLLNVLRPDIIIEKHTFKSMLSPNKYISKAIHYLRTTEDGWMGLAAEQLREIAKTEWGAAVIVTSPTYSDVIKLLSVQYEGEISREQRVKLISDVESLNTFSGLINRTRRQDIGDFCIRRSHTVESVFTEYQQILHDELLAFETAALSMMHSTQNIKFMIGTIRRQAASCIFGLAPFVRNLINKRFVQILDDPEIDIDSKAFENDDCISTVKKLSEHILELADNLPEDDPKFDSIAQIIRQKQQTDNNKIIVFSTFRHTLAYVCKRLTNEGYRVARVDGSVADEERLALRHRFELPKSDLGALDILLFTEVGCEGLDYQFCDTMINYDLPWNPMRIEQRIGRIDRRGQKSDIVNIYNMITENTIDADIYHRCLLRIGIFEDSIGECSEILGNISRELEKISISSNLSDEERRFKIEQMADNEIRKIEEIKKLEEEEKQLFGLNLSEMAFGKEVDDAKNIWISPLFIRHMVSQYLSERLGEKSYITGESQVKSLRLSASARKTLLDDYRALGGAKTALKRKWEQFLKGITPTCQITFEADCAEKNREIFFITPMHPLAMGAAANFVFDKAVQVALELSDSNYPSGLYPFALYAWHYKGFNAQCNIVAVCEDYAVQENLMEILRSVAQSTNENLFDNISWEQIEKLHLNMWQSERTEYIANAGRAAECKLESLNNNFRNRRRELNKIISDAQDENILRMKMRELENVEAWYDKKVAETEESTLKADIHTKLLIKGILAVN